MNVRSNTVMTVAEIKQLLEQFLALDALKQHALYRQLKNIPSYFSRVEALQAELKDKSDGELKVKKDKVDDISMMLCKALTKWMYHTDFANIEYNDMKFNLVLFQAALTLSKLNPINPIDAATLEPPEIPVYTSDRYQHELDTLVRWLPEHATSPQQNRVEFGELDKERLVEICSEYTGKKFEIDKTIRYLGGDPDLDATLTFARDLQGQEQNAQQGARRRNYANDAMHIIDLGLEYPPHPMMTQAAQFLDFTPQIQTGVIGSSTGSLFGLTFRPFLFRDARPENSLPVRTLPAWMSATGAVTLPNGNIALVENENHGVIRIINPETNDTVLRIQDNDRDMYVSSIVLLPSGNIAVGHYDSDASINVYNPETGALINAVEQVGGINSHLMLVRGNQILCSDRRIRSDINIVDSETGCHIGLITPGISIYNMTANENYLAVIGSHQCVIYDHDFRPIHQLDVSDRMVLEVAILPNNHVAVACECRGAGSFKIYDPVTGDLTSEFDVPESNVIRSISALDNGNLMMADSSGHIKEYTHDGRLVNEARTNLRVINAINDPAMLKLAYERIAARGELHAVNGSDETQTPPLSPS